MLKEMRGKEIAEGDVIGFITSMIPEKIMPGMVLAVSGSMVKHHPQMGELISQNVKVMFVFNMEVQKGMTLPFPVLDKSDEQPAKLFLEEVVDLIAKLKESGGGSTGSSVIVAG